MFAISTLLEPGLSGLQSQAMRVGLKNRAKDPVSPRGSVPAASGRSALRPSTQTGKRHVGHIQYRNALLVYPECPPTFWGFNFALEFSGQKAMFPPLGLLSVAAMFPPEYDLRLVDMNVRRLEDSDLEWADIVFASAMIVQKDSLQAVVDRCGRAGIPVVAGGPYPTSYHDEIQGVDHFVLDEVEETFPEFLRDLEHGTGKAIYREAEKPDVTKTPVPRFDLIDLDDYHSMCVQFSRGCPFNCEFCDITKLFGRVPRTKTPGQMLEEFESLYRLGWRGKVFLVDDNFIGNKRKALELLPHVAEWQRGRGYPFSLITEATVNLATTEALMDSMVDAGFHNVFLGIETPNPDALVKTRKQQNTSRKQENYLLGAVRTIQRRGMRVAGGFILGLDEDDESVFGSQIEFIQAAGIPLAMVGLLTVVRGTDLHKRMQAEGRLLQNATTGNQLNMVLNFIPEMDSTTLLDGYRRVLTTIYDPTLENYFSRCVTMLQNVRFSPRLSEPFDRNLLKAFVKSIYRQILSKQGPAYLRFIARVIRIDPRLLPEAFSLAILGYHFEMVGRLEIEVHDFKQYLASELESLRKVRSRVDGTGIGRALDPHAEVTEMLSRAESRYRKLHRNFRQEIESSMDSFRGALDESVSAA